MLVLIQGMQFAAPALSDQCDDRLRAVSGSIGYKRRDGRCEGFYISPVAAMRLEVVSLLKGKLRYELRPNARLEVSAPDIADIAREPVRVRAVALPLGTYYRMDAELQSGCVLSWPVDDVLLPAQLHMDRIGVFGWVEKESEKIFVPLEVIQEGAQHLEEPVELVVRPQVDIEALKWRSLIEGEPLSQPPKWLDAATTPVSAGRPVAVVVPGGPTKVLRVEFAAKVRNSDKWLTLIMRMVRAGSK